ncbi:MAG: ABC transporter permease [Pirellulales bacterium]
MLNYVIRRLIIGGFTLLMITFVVYGLIRSMPGSPLTIDLAESSPDKQISKEELERRKEIYGLNDPWPIAYAKWIWGCAQLDFGESIHEKQPVLKVIAPRIGPTLLLSVSSLSLSFLLAVPMGLYCTSRSGHADERTLSVGLYMMYSIPSFVAALLLLLAFYVKLDGTIFHLKPGMVSDNYESLSASGKLFDIFKHAILPVFCFTYGSLAYYSRFVKANMEEVIRQDYIRTARAKGVPPMKVLIKHAFRNTLIPFVTMLGLTLPGLLSGSVILEEVFSWPGMGRLFFAAITNRDYKVLMAETLIYAVMTLAGQLLADLLYAFVDPRVTYS